MRFTTVLLKVSVLSTAIIFCAQAGAAPFADSSSNARSQRAGMSARKIIPPVPRPETWAMMGVGLTVFGAVARRRLVRK